MGKAYLHNLTALRGIAALLVVIHHFDFFYGSLLPAGSSGVIYKTYLMVDLFFALSGFVICYVYEETFSSKFSLSTYKNFILARFSRVYPLHIFTLLATILLYLILIIYDKDWLLNPLQKHMHRWDSIPIQLLFLQTIGIYDFDTWNAPAWSLSAEWWAYMIFPITFIVVSRIRKTHATFLGVLIIIGGWLFLEYYLSPRQPFFNFPLNSNNFALDLNWHYGTLRGIVGFVMGMLMWRLYKQDKLKRLLGNGWTLLALVFATLICMHFKLPDTATVTLCSFVVLSIAYGSIGIDRFFNWTPFQKLGIWSFSIYIWHMVFLRVISTWYILQRTEPHTGGMFKPFNSSLVESWTAFLIILPIILFLSWLSYRFLEKPSRDWLNRKLVKK
ncbi:MAG: acyltransferase [Cyclobacteriaceae bacterium]